MVIVRVFFCYYEKVTKVFYILDYCLAESSTTWLTNARALKHYIGGYVSATSADWSYKIKHSFRILTQTRSRGFQKRTNKGIETKT